VAPHALLVALEGVSAEAPSEVLTMCGGPRRAVGDLHTVTLQPYGAGLSFRTKMLAGSVPCVMAKNGNTAAPSEPSPS
jgi:hypothetical protein